MHLEIGDILLVKKPHPCGSHEFEVVRKGADFKLTCKGCQKDIWISREKLEKRVRKVNGQAPE